MDPVYWQKITTILANLSIHLFPSAGGLENTGAPCGEYGIRGQVLKSLAEAANPSSYWVWKEKTTTAQQDDHQPAREVKEEGDASGMLGYH